MMPTWTYLETKLVNTLHMMELITIKVLLTVTLAVVLYRLGQGILS